MAETKEVAEKPKNNLWNGALKMVKGDNTHQLIEQFTSEMTLVAEGLCEDQSKLRQEMDGMMTEEDRRIQKLESRIELLETSLEEERNEHEQAMKEARGRIAALEKKAASSGEKEKTKSRRSIIRDLTWLVGIAGGAWIIVTILNMIK